MLSYHPWTGTLGSGAPVTVLVEGRCARYPRDDHPFLRMVVSRLLSVEETEVESVFSPEELREWWDND